MRSTLVWIGFSCLALLISWTIPGPLNAQSLPSKGSVTVYGFAGGIDLSMDDVNSSLIETQDFLRENFILADYETFGLSFSLGGGLSYQLTERFALGAEYHYAKQDLTNNTFTGDPHQHQGFLNSASGKVQDVTLDLTWYPPLDVGMFVGGGLGYGWSDMSQTIGLTDEANPESDTFLDGVWTASGITGQAYLGCHFDFVWGTKITARGGYRYLKMTGTDGTTVQRSFDETVPAEQLPLGTLDWDFSGWNAVLTLGYSFFGD